MTQPVLSTPGVLQDAEPAKWRQHRYGLSPERWDRFAGRTFWITGAGTGYGRSIAVALAAAGARVILSGRRRSKLEESIEEMKTFAVPTTLCHAVECDITDPQDIERACARVIALTQSLHGLVNNAALPSTANPYPLQEDSLGNWEKLLRTNVTAQWQLTRRLMPYMLKGSEGRVLFVTSEAGWASTPGFGPYNVSKAALNALAASVAAEYAERFPEADIQVNTLVPGEAKTEMNRRSRESPYAVVSMTLLLLSHPKGGPNGRFFHRDGRHLSFAYTTPYERKLG
jgi:3-oxoacyl-[acyl-carrier protein] reductase